VKWLAALAVGAAVGLALAGLFIAGYAIALAAILASVPR
jgi:hypothetical protein